MRKIILSDTIDEGCYDIRVAGAASVRGVATEAAVMNFFGHAIF